ncbi:MAG TPA: SlyX family protein [Azospirillaceae bacterium]|nr:SlyX family protein [Azospirillaceae bacterium]
MSDRPHDLLDRRALERRIVELETRNAHLERQAEELSAELLRQGRAIDALTLRLHRLSDRLGDLEGGWSPSPADERPPPHY